MALTAANAFGQPPRTPMRPAVAIEDGTSRLPAFPELFEAAPSQPNWYEGGAPLGLNLPNSDLSGWAAGTWIGGGEMSWLRPYTQQGSGPESARFHLEPGWRIWAGYKRDDGWGLAAKSWQSDFETGTELTPTGHTVSSAVQARTADVEFNHEFPFRLWSLTGGGGLRYGSLETWRTNSQFAAQPIDQARFQGFGPSIFLNGRKPLTPEWAAIANSRYSLLFGTVNDDLDFGSPGPGRSNDAFLQMLDLQFGGEWTRPCSHGGRWFVRLVFEAQVWHASGLDTLQSDLTFAGPTIAVGIDR